MGLFGNSKTREFKNKTVDVLNLISKFSYGELPMSMSSTIDTTINSNYQQLKNIYNQFSNPFEEYFNFYSNFTSVLGEKTSVAEGMYIIYLTRELAFQGHRISTSVHQKIMLEAKSLSSSYTGRLTMESRIRNS